MSKPKDRRLEDLHIIKDKLDQLNMAIPPVDIKANDAVRDIYDQIYSTLLTDEERRIFQEERKRMVQ